MKNKVLMIVLVLIIVIAVIVGIRIFIKYIVPRLIYSFIIWLGENQI